MASTTEATVVKREVAIDARPETVWEFLVDPAKAVRWMGTRAEFDVTPGGSYEIEVLSGHVARGEFVELDPPRRLVLTWGWEGTDDTAVAVPPGSSRVEFELVPDGDGTLLRFQHELPTLEEAQKHNHGWEHYLGRLAVAATGRDPGSDPWLSGEM